MSKENINKDNHAQQNLVSNQPSIKSLPRELGFTFEAYTNVLPIPNDSQSRRTIFSRIMGSALKPGCTNVTFQNTWDTQGFLAACKLMKKSALFNPFTYLGIGFGLARVYTSVACDVFTKDRDALRAKSNVVSIILKAIFMTPLSILCAICKIGRDPKRILMATKNALINVKNKLVAAKNIVAKKFKSVKSWFKTKVMGGRVMTAVADTLRVRGKNKTVSYERLSNNLSRRNSIAMDDLSETNWENLSEEIAHKEEVQSSVKEFGLFSPSNKAEKMDDIELELINGNTLERQ